MYTVFSQIVSDDTAKIVSVSWTNGCEAYVGQAYQNSENTLFQAAAVEGQSIFVAAGDQGAEGCNINGVVGAHRRAPTPWRRSSTRRPAPSTSPTSPPTRSAWTARAAPAILPTASAEGSVSTGSGPDAVALDTTDGKVFVANAAPAR